MEIIIKALKLKNFDHIKLAKLAGFNEKELEMVKLFWEPAFNNSWIYLSSEIIHDYFGYKKSKTSVGDFYKKMREIYKEKIDYKEVDKDNNLVKFYENLYLEKNPDWIKASNNRSKYYIVTGTAFKKMGMKANTKKGDETCDYFIKVEGLCSLMVKYTIEKLKLDNEKQFQEQTKQLQIKDIEIEEHKALIKQKDEEAKWLFQKGLTDAKFYKRTIEDKENNIYFGGHAEELKNYNIKLGKSEDISKRKKNHSLSSPDNNPFVIVKEFATYHDLALPTEHFMHAILRPLCINEKRKEHFLINGIFLDKFVTKTLSFVDILVKDVNGYVSLIKDNKYNYDKVGETIRSETKQIEPAPEIKPIEFEIKIEPKITTTQKYIKCKLCGALFSTGKGLQAHYKRKTPCNVVLKCDKCDRIFETAYNLNQHINKPVPCNAPLNCKFCDKEFTLLSKLNTHYNRVNPCA